MSVDEKVILTPEQAITMLADGDDIHTFMQGGFTLLGADWSRQDVLKAINTENAVLELAGPVATRMGHGLVVWLGNEPLFVATKEAAHEQD